MTTKTLRCQTITWASMLSLLALCAAVGCSAKSETPPPVANDMAAFAQSVSMTQERLEPVQQDLNAFLQRGSPDAAKRLSVSLARPLCHTEVGELLGIRWYRLKTNLAGLASRYASECEVLKHEQSLLQRSLAADQGVRRTVALELDTQCSLKSVSVIDSPETAPANSLVLPASYVTELCQGTEARRGAIRLLVLIAGTSSEKGLLQLGNELELELERIGAK